MAYIREVTCAAFQLVDTGFVVWWGSSGVCCFDKACECVSTSENYHEIHELGTGFFVQHRRVSAVKKVEFVSDRVSYIDLRGR